jgi:hypothetical protein
VEELGYHTLSETVSPACANVHAFVLVLMEDQDVEPLISELKGSFEFNFLILERNIEPLVLHVSYPIQSQLCWSFLEQDWYHLDVFNVGNLSEIVYIVIRTHKVDITKILKPTRVVVVTMDYENWQFYTEILIHVVRIVVLICLKFNVLFSKYELVHQLLHLEKCLSAWLVVMEEISTQ